MWVSGEVRTSQEESLLKPPARMLWRCWEALRAGRSAPERRDLDLKQLRHLVPYLFIAERLGGDEGFVWRLAGTGLCDLHRRELTGLDLLAGWDAFERSVMLRFLNCVVTSHKQAVLRLAYATDRGQQFGAEMLALPLMAADGVSTHVLGGLFPAAQQDIRYYDTLMPLEVAFARFLDPAAPEEPAAAGTTQARRKFRVISGGLGQS
jgi:hypothetical protein